MVDSLEALPSMGLSFPRVCMHLNSSGSAQDLFTTLASLEALPSMELSFSCVCMQKGRLSTVQGAVSI